LREGQSKMGSVISDIGAVGRETERRERERERERQRERERERERERPCETLQIKSLLITLEVI
jgi:membrane protein involved in colicin uptake